MTLKEFKKLRLGTVVVYKKSRAKVTDLTKYLAEIEYLKSGFKIMVKPRQIRLLNT